MLNGEPCLFFRDSDKHVLAFMDNSEENWNRLAALSLDHRFEVLNEEETLIIRQGECDTRTVLSEFAEGGGDGPRTIINVIHDEHVANACQRCGMLGDCSQRFENWTRISRPLFKPFRQNTIEIMRVQQERDFRDACALVTIDHVPIELTLQRKHMRDAGFHPIRAHAHFHGDEVRASDIEWTKTLLARGVEPSQAWDTEDKEQLVWVNGAGGDGFDVAKSIKGMTPAGMCFNPEIVQTNMYRAALRGHRNGVRQRDIKAFRARECSRCVYDCPKTPWDGTKDPCALTLEDVVSKSNFALDERHLTWLAAWTLTGSKLTYDRKKCIGFGPYRHADGEVSMNLARLVPPFEIIHDVPMDEYLKKAGIELSGHIVDEIECTDPETLAVTYWVLEQLNEHFRWGDTRFYGFGSRHDGASRNDVLYVHVSNNMRYIAIGSDTRASSGGGFHYRGSSLSTKDRPRFTTHYDYPFLETIRENLDFTPGTRGGRRR